MRPSLLLVGSSSIATEASRTLCGLPWDRFPPVLRQAPLSQAKRPLTSRVSDPVIEQLEASIAAALGNQLTTKGSPSQGRDHLTGARPSRISAKSTRR